MAGTDWGHSQEELLTYKLLGVSQLNCADPIYSPYLKPLNMQKLQRVENRCLRTVTGNHAASSLEHVNRKTLTLPVDDHLQLLSRQFLAKASVNGHSYGPVVNGPQGPRAIRGIRETLSSRHAAAVRPFLCNGSFPSGSVKEVMTDLRSFILSFCFILFLFLPFLFFYHF